MADTTSSELTFTIHALGDTDGKKPVPAEVFVAKVREFFDALKAADRSANHAARHEYVVSDLEYGSASVTFCERPLPSFAEIGIKSSVTEFMDCMEVIHDNNEPAAGRFGGLVEKLARATSGAGERFAYIDVEKKGGNEIRADQILAKQASIISERLKLLLAKPAPSKFAGSAAEGFDGSILEVDLRKGTKRCKLVLSDGTKELDCEFVGFTTEDIRANLDMRVWAEGRAIYNGEDGLPVRFEIMSVRPIGGRNDLEKWRGRLSPRQLGEDWFE